VTNQGAFNPLTIPGPRDITRAMILQGRFQGLRHSPQWAGQIHCVVTSPPYNTGSIAYAGYVDKLSEAQYMALATEFALTMDHCCAPGAPVFVNIAPVMAVDPMQTFRWIQEVCRDLWTFKIGLLG